MNNSEFNQLIFNSTKPVVIDFWAPWCAPCMATKPILEELSREYADTVAFIPVNADHSREVIERFRVFGIPTVIAVRNGNEIGRATGAQNEAGYRAIFESLAKGGEVKIPLTAFDRILRLGAGSLFAAIGAATGNWLVIGIGGILAFLGVYDRCPIWRAVTGMFGRK